MYSHQGYSFDPIFTSFITPHPCQTLVVFELPYNSTESDLHGLFSKFGTVEKVQKVANGRAALIQFSEISSPTRLVHMAKINPFYVATTPVRLEFSSQTINIKETKASEGKKSNQPTQEEQNEAESTSEPTKILQLDVSNVEYPITVEVIKSICMPHGSLKRIFVGTKRWDNTVKALAEYDNEEQATKAREHINGADIYSGCCNLSVTYSTLDKIKVAKNDSQQWDCANPAPKTLLDSSVEYTAPFAGYSTPHHPYHPYPGHMAPHHPYWGGPPAMPVPQVPTAPHAYLMLPVPAPVHAVTKDGIGIGHAISNLGEASSNRHEDMSIFSNEPGCVIIVSNLPPNVNCDHMFNLFGLYGNIAKVRFLLSQENTAMVQFGAKEAAEFAFKYLNDILIMDARLKIMQSNWLEIKDEFRSPTLSSKSRILEPSRTLHFFNAPPSFTPPDICLLFHGQGLQTPPRVLIFSNKLPQKKTSLGLVEWDRTEEALNALIFCNNKPVHLSGHTHPYHLKLAFSPKPLNEDRNGMTMISSFAPPPSPKSFKPSNTDELYEQSKEKALAIETAEDEFVNDSERKSGKSSRCPASHTCNKRNNI
ncbi:hypothetical protein Ciccas_010595 [Cichlidogyrus casuarinus]|uniref:RRM domain-containing protein n=1 Tax=Cichlidogyrus casuarinus TaxID=1844966 RepID=A0ABD2PTP3_9PLAT